MSSGRVVGVCWPATTPILIFSYVSNREYSPLLNPTAETMLISMFFLAATLLPAATLFPASRSPAATDRVSHSVNHLVSIQIILLWCYFLFSFVGDTFSFSLTQPVRGRVRGFGSMIGLIPRQRSIIFSSNIEMDDRVSHAPYTGDFCLFSHGSVQRSSFTTTWDRLVWWTHHHGIINDQLAALIPGWYSCASRHT